jgi:hypothetical protein
MRQFLSDWLWIYTGYGRIPRLVLQDCSSPTGSPGRGAASAIVSALALVGACLWLVFGCVGELVYWCPMGRLTMLMLLLAGSTFLALPRVGLEQAKAAGCRVEFARLAVIVATTVWWTVVALVAWFVFSPVRR